MAKHTLRAAMLAALIGSAATAATNGGGSASLAGRGAQALAGRAGRPTYVEGGWVCPPGFVWRNAGKTDWLCVDPGEARRIEQENRYAPATWAAEPDGTYACRTGLVPRGAFKGDRVCVDPSRQALVRQMNLALFDIR